MFTHVMTFATRIKICKDHKIDNINLFYTSNTAIFK